MITYSFELADKILLKLFENQHPKKLRWGVRLKTNNFDDENSYYIYIKDGETVMGEIILGWLSKDVCEVDSFTILPEYQGKGHGKALLSTTIAWIKENGFNSVHAVAKIPVSSNLFIKFGFTAGNKEINWAETGLEYLSVNLKLNI